MALYSKRRFFPLWGWGGIKNGRCVPSVVGEGSGISFRRCSPVKPRRSHLGLADWARCQRHKMAEEPRDNLQAAGDGAGRKAAFFGIFFLRI